MCFLASGIFAGRKADAPEKSVVLLVLLQRPTATEEIKVLRTLRKRDEALEGRESEREALHLKEVEEQDCRLCREGEQRRWRLKTGAGSAMQSGGLGAK